MESHGSGEPGVWRGARVAGQPGGLESQEAGEPHGWELGEMANPGAGQPRGLKSQGS